MLKSSSMLMNPTPIYDPNSEVGQTEQNAALHWELLRRNKAFQTVAQQWIKDPGFRIQHANSDDYQNSMVHFQRCALDWMISAGARLALAQNQIAAGRWFREAEFNFGPVVVT